MAPRVLDGGFDISGYSPVPIHLGRKKRQASGSRQGILNSASNASRPKDQQSPYFWHLTSDEITEIENSKEYFQCTLIDLPTIAEFDRVGLALGLPLHAINNNTFPLSNTLRSKLRVALKSIYGRQQFVILSGLDPSRYSDIGNIIIHAGLSSHVGAKRGMAGREGGDRSVLSEPCVLESNTPSPNAISRPHNSNDLESQRKYGPISRATKSG